MKDKAPVPYLSVFDLLTTSIRLSSSDSMGVVLAAATVLAGRLSDRRLGK